MKTLFPKGAMTRCRVSWRNAFERIRVCGFWFNNLIRALNQTLTTEWCIATRLFWRSARKIARKSGYLFLALYLKQARVCLQKYAAGDVIPFDSLSPRVSLTRCGLPTIIPSFHRKKIRGGDHRIIQLYMSLFSISKLIDLAKKITHTLFDSITAPADHGPQLHSVVTHMSDLLEPLFRRYVPGIDRMTLEQCYSAEPTWKTVPSWGDLRRSVRKATRTKDISKDAQHKRSVAKIAEKHLKRPSCFPGYLFESISAHLELYPEVLGLFGTQTYYPFDCERNDSSYLTHSEGSADSTMLQWNFSERKVPFMDVLYSVPKICMSCTGDGKRRLFTVGNFVRQKLLSPLHDWCGKVLSSIKMDGTYDQLAPLDRLKGVRGYVYSVDLTAATDRFPVSFTSAMLLGIFGGMFTFSAMFALTGTFFEISFLRLKPKVVFEVGQPLGYRSSWPLFALSHHVLVWYAAEQVLPGVLFKRYAILGDDIVIADDKVYRQYIKLLDILRLTVSKSKSLVSKFGAAEFAKKFRLRQMTVDVSPISIKQIMFSREPIGWITFVTSLPRPISLAAALRIGGLGFRAASRPIGSRNHGRQARYMIALWVYFGLKRLKITSAFSIFTAILGKVVHHQAVAKVFRELMKSFAPKDLVPVPDGLCDIFDETSLSLMEYGPYIPWVKRHLKYLKWYADMLQAPELTLEMFIDAPVYVRTWNAPRLDLETFRFGAIFIAIDIAGQFRERDAVPELTELSRSISSVGLSSLL